MPEIGRLVAIIDGDLSGLERALGNAQKVLNRAGNQMSAAGRALSIGVTAPIVAIGGLAIKASMDFETAFAGVNKTVDASAQELAVLRKGIIDMSKEMPATAVEIAGVAEAAGQLGVKKEDILGFTRTMVMLGETTNLTATEAATSMAKFANVMQVPAKDIERLASVLVDLGNNGASTERDILEMAQRIAAAGKTVGMSATDVLSLANALSSVGINAEAGGTAVSRVLIDMAQAAANLKPTEEQLKAIGDAQRDVRDSGLALESANRGVRDAFEGVADAQRGVRDSTEGIASAQRNTRNATESLRDAQTALTRAYRDQRQASLDARRETLSVAEAQQGLREVQSQAGSGALEVRSAQLALAEAQKRLGEASKKGGLEQAQAALGVQQAQARLNQVMIQGPRYALDLRNAQLRLEEAQSRVGRAAEQSRDQIVQAQRGVRNASEGMAEAQRAERNAVEGVAGAQRNLRNAYEGVGEAQNAAVVAQEKYADSQAKLNTLMDQVFGKLGNYAKLAGMLPEQFAELVKTNPSEAFTRVVEGMQRVQKEGGNLFKILEELGLDDIRVRDTMLSLANGGDILRNSLNLGRKAFEDNSALTVEYGKKSATTAAQMEIMRNRVTATMIALGDELTPTLLEASQNMMPMIDAFAKLTALFAAAPGPVQTAVIAFFGFSAALGPSLFGLGQMFKMTKDVMMLMKSATMIKAFAAMRAGFMSLGTALLTPPLGIVVALIALGVAIYIFRDDIWKVLKPALDWAAEAFGKVGEAVSDGLGGALDFVKSHWKEIATLLEGALGGLVDTAGGLASSVAGAIADAFTGAVGVIGDAIGTIVSTISSNFTAENMGKMFGDMLFAPVRMFRMAFEAVLPVLTTFFGSTLPGFFTKTIPAVASAAATLGKSIVTGIVNAIKAIPGFIATAAVTVANSAIGLGKAVMNGILTGLTTYVSLVKTFWTSTLPGVVTGATSTIVNAALAVGKAMITGVSSGITAAISVISSAPRVIVNAFVSGFNAIKNEVLSIGKMIVQGVWSGIQSMKDWLYNQIKSFFSGLVKSAKSAVGVKSPSTVFAGIGENIVKGLSNGLEGANNLTVAAPQMVAANWQMPSMPMVQMPSYNQTPAYATRTPSFDQTAGNNGASGLSVEINGPVKVQNIGRRKDAKGALGDLAFGVQGQLNRRGIYA